MLLTFKIPLTSTLNANPFKFLVFLGKRFIEDRCPQHASALAYTTLLSIVPLMAVTFSIFTAFPVFENLTDDFQSFLFQNFVPTSAELLQTYLLEFVQKASGLTALGIGGLMATSILLMAAINRALNTIWRTQTPRSSVVNFLVYWAVLTLSPLLMGISLAVSSYIVSLPLISDTTNNIHVLRVTPFIMSACAFSVLYILVPSQRVPIRPAVAGGLVAALLFELAKKGFAFYVTQFPTYQAIYGALAILPIFLVWIYVCWVIVLLGAEITHSLLSYRDEVLHPHYQHSKKFYYVIRLLGHLWEAQGKGECLSIDSLEDREPMLNRDQLEALLASLEKANIVHTTSLNRWALSQDLSRFSVYQLFQLNAYALPNLPLKENHDDHWQTQFEHMLASCHQHLQHEMGMYVAELYREPALLVSRPALNINHSEQANGNTASILSN